MVIISYVMLSKCKPLGWCVFSSRHPHMVMCHAIKRQPFLGMAPRGVCMHLSVRRGIYICFLLVLWQVFFSGCLHGDEQVGPTAVMETAKLMVYAAMCHADSTAKVNVTAIYTQQNGQSSCIFQNCVEPKIEVYQPTPGAHRIVIQHSSIVAWWNYVLSRCVCAAE